MHKISSTIRRKILLPIIATVFAVLCALLFVACAHDPSIQDVVDMGYPVMAYYFDDETNLGDLSHCQRIMVAEGSYLATPGKEYGLVKIPTKENYSYKGFYVVEENEDGTYTVTDKKWNFSTDRVADKNVILCAMWWDNFKINLHYGNNYSLVKTVPVSRLSDDVGTPNSSSISPSSFTQDNYTFLSYNSVKDGGAATEIDFSKWKLTLDMFDNADLAYDVYGKSLDGVYQLVRTAGDFSLSAATENTNYYLLADINLNGHSYDDEAITNTTKLPKTYNGKFIGNGHTISNFEMKLASLDSTYSNFGLFRSLGAGAVIDDVTFENFTLNYNISIPSIHYEVGILAGQATSTAKVNKVNVACTFSYTLGDSVNVDFDNIQLISHVDSTATVTESYITDITKLVPLTVSVSIDFVTSTTAAKTCRIAVMYSEKDGNKAIESIRSFKYVEVIGGREFEYTLTFEATKNADNTWTVHVSDNRYEGNLTLTFTPVDSEAVFTVSVAGTIGQK